MLLLLLFFFGEMIDVNTLSYCSNFSNAYDTSTHSIHTNGIPNRNFYWRVDWLCNTEPLNRKLFGFCCKRRRKLIRSLQCLLDYPHSTVFFNNINNNVFVLFFPADTIISMILSSNWMFGWGVRDYEETPNNWMLWLLLDILFLDSECS